jgi:hypothetical protein
LTFYETFCPLHRRYKAGTYPERRIRTALSTYRAIMERNGQFRP